MSGQQLNLTEITAILKLCKRLGVSTLSFGSLNVSFGPSSELQTTVRHRNLLDAKTELALALARKEDELSLLAIEDPLSYEKHVLSDDSVNDDSGLDA